MVDSAFILGFPVRTQVSSYTEREGQHQANRRDSCWRVRLPNQMQSDNNKLKKNNTICWKQHFVWCDLRRLMNRSARKTRDMNSGMCSMAHHVAQQKKKEPWGGLVCNPLPSVVRAITDLPRRVVGIMTWSRNGYHRNDGSILGWHMVCTPTFSCGRPYRPYGSLSLFGGYCMRFPRGKIGQD
jgi:hypothetical protein